jgi:hypothetical protein
MAPRLSLALLVVALCARARAEPLVLPTVSLVVKDDATLPIEPKKRFFKLRSGTKTEPVVHIVPPAVGGAGDPTIGGATLTVYNTDGVPQVATYALPAARWSLIGTATTFKGYQFHDDTPVDGPVVRIFVKPDKIFVAGGKANWTYLLGTTPQGRVAARLALGADDGWCVEAPAQTPPAVYDTPVRFVGAKGARPPTCPPVP